LPRILYLEILNTVADALQVKRPHGSKPFMVEIAWRIDAIAAWLLNRKRKLTGHSSCFLLDK
jgi:hypothetical protein